MEAFVFFGIIIAVISIFLVAFSSSNQPDHPSTNVQFLEEFDEYIRLNFKELPFEDFEVPIDLGIKLQEECDKAGPTLTTLQQIVIEMEHHLGYRNNSAIVFLDKKGMMNKAGMIEKTSYSFSEITISVDRIYKAKNYIAIIAHELSHAYQEAKLKPLYQDKELSEKFTDALTVYIGFGHLYKDGLWAEKKTIDDYDKTTEKRRLGYLEEQHFETVFRMKDKLLLIKRQVERKKIERENDIKRARQLGEVYTQYKSYLIDQIDTLKEMGSISSMDLLLIQSTISKYIESNLDLHIIKTINVIEKVSDDQRKSSLYFLKSTITEMVEIKRKLDTIETRNTKP